MPVEWGFRCHIGVGVVDEQGQKARKCLSGPCWTREDTGSGHMGSSLFSGNDLDQVMISGSGDGSRPSLVILITECLLLPLSFLQLR